MRWTPIVFAATLLASFAVEAVEPAAGQDGQAISTSASPPAAQQPAAPGDPPAVAMPPATADPAAPVVPAEAAADPASGLAGAAGSQPVTLKMATVPPPANFKVPPGYHAVKHGLETVYCTRYTPIGSRMSQKVCMSREQVEAMLRQQEETRRDLAKAGACSGACGAN